MTVSVSMDMWNQWLLIAHSRVQAAELARQRLVDAVAADDEASRGSALEEEFQAGMVAIAACAFAVDSFYASVYERMKKRPTRRTGGRHAARYRWITETLRQAFTLSSKGTKSLQEFLKKLFSFRDWAVHPASDFRHPIPHPVLGSGVEWRFIAFSADNARIVLDQTMSVVEQLLERPTSGPLQEWVAATRERLVELRHLGISDEHGRTAG